MQFLLLLLLLLPVRIVKWKEVVIRMENNLNKKEKDNN